MFFGVTCERALRAKANTCTLIGRMVLGRLALAPLTLASLIFASLTLASLGAQAATPVEDRSTATSPVRGVTDPQPVLPDELRGTAGGNPPAAATDPYSAAGVVTAPPSAPAQSGGQNAQLFYELQLLQTELLQLRGVVEDQAFEIQRLRELQRSQYLDIDRRLTDTGAPAASGGVSPGLEPAARQPSLIAGSAAAEPVTTVTTPQPIVDNTTPSLVAAPATPAAENPATSVSQTAAQKPAAVSTPASTTPDTVATEASSTAPVTPPVPTVPSEQDAYTRAFELMKDQQFEQSIVAYQDVVDSFPDGEYAPESRYWLGELYLMSDRLEDARGAFNQVVDEFPAHQKVPLSLYKLGVVNHRLGVTPRALEYLDDVVVRYPDTPAAGLARTYAAELR